MKNWEGKTFLPPLFQFPPLIGGTCPFYPPVEAIHAVTITSLKARPIGLQLSVGTVLISRQFVSFHRSSFGRQGVQPLKSGRVKTYSCPLASKSGGANSPSLPYSLFHPWLGGRLVLSGSVKHEAIVVLLCSYPRFLLSVFFCNY